MSENLRVLIVEDDHSSADLYRKTLKTDRRSSFDVKWADNLAKALEYEQGGIFDVILLDLQLPDSRGFDTFAKVKREAQDASIIILTGSRDEALAIRAIEEGAQDYISKGQFEYRMFLRAISYAIERNRIRKNLQHTKNDLEAKVRRRTYKLQTEKGKMHRILAETIDALASALEKRDPYTAGHQRRVAQLSVAIAKHIGLKENGIIGLHLASLVHDIGKICVPIEILVKPTPLNKVEMNLIHTHSEVGYGILKDIEFPWPIARVVLQHHEKIDGSGYPHGLSGEDILLESRILCVADVTEAMFSDRPYRSAIGIAGALEELSRNKRILYEPVAVDACLELFNKKSFKFE